MDYEKLSDDRVGESSEAIRARVQAARNIQQKRFSNGSSDIICNADMRVGEIRQFCKLQDEGAALTTVGSVEASKPDVCGDESDESLGARLSSYAKRETRTHDRGSGGK